MRAVRVVAAVVGRGGRILVARRREGGERGGQWEFPGGKVEPGESEPAALRREIREELGCEVEVGRLLVRHRHRYPDLEVELAFYAAELPPGAVPQPLGCAALEWADGCRLAARDFCEADRPVLAALAHAVGAQRRRGRLVRRGGAGGSPETRSASETGSKARPPSSRRRRPSAPSRRRV